MLGRAALPNQVFCLLSLGSAINAVSNYGNYIDSISKQANPRSFIAQIEPIAGFIKLFGIQTGRPDSGNDI